MRKNKGAARRRKAKSTIKILLILVLALVVLAVGAAGFYVNYLLNQIDYEDEDETVQSVSYETDGHGNIIIGSENGIDEGVNGNGEEPDESYEIIDDEAAKTIADGAKDVAEDDSPIHTSSDVVNILLIGVDARTPGQLTNSDVMMLLSINRAKQTITMSSLMRDMYVSIPGVGNTKLNHANSLGGPNLLLQTVRQNFRVDVSEYILVDFYQMANIVDILGGVTVTVSEAEVPHINSSVRMTNQISGRPADEGLLQSSGTVRLTGPQAVGYSRIRYVGNADFGRTQRQRTVMTAIFNQIRGSSLATLNQLATSILPEVKTNISRSDILGYMTLIPQAASYPITQLQIPANGSFSFATIGGLSYLVPDIQANRDLLRQTIY